MNEQCRFLFFVSNINLFLVKKLAEKRAKLLAEEKAAKGILLFVHLQTHPYSP